MCITPSRGGTACTEQRNRQRRNRKRKKYVRRVVVSPKLVSYNFIQYYTTLYRKIERYKDRKIEK